MTGRLYFENNMRRVPYVVDYINPRFKDLLKEEGGQSISLDRLVSWATTGRRIDGTARSLITGGRVVTYQLDRPFVDPILRLPITEIDVKGVGLTSSGYIQDGKELETDRPIEIARHKTRGDLFGVESLKEARAGAVNLNLVRRLGMFAPIPLAVVKLKKLVYQGELIDPRGIVDLFELPKNSEFAMLIRGYVGTATRMTDLFDWRDDYANVLCTTPYGNREAICPDNVVKEARYLFEKYERKKVVDKDIVDWYEKMITLTVEQLALQISTGLSPCSGKEKSRECEGQPYHTHLQNQTIGGMEVEFVPMTEMRQLPEDRLRQHVREVFESRLDFIAALGMACLPKNELVRRILDYEGFLALLETRIPRNKHLRFLNVYRRKSSEEVKREEEEGKKAILLKLNSRGGFYSEWLKENIGLVCR